MASPASLPPARRQVAKEKVLGPQAAISARGGQAGQTYNIYYDKWSGGERTDRSDRTLLKDKAGYRCDPVRDSGRTKGTYNANAYFCAFFAKGCCPNGEDCRWLHRIPTRQDHVDSGMDVFGRERFNDHRDDRGGVGSMRSDSRTLYVGRIHQDPNIEAAVEKHFKIWGEVERIKVLREKGVAFVTYQSRLNAEFAKEAMANQSMDHGEIVNIRWATEDPNPGVQAANKRKAVELTRQTIEARLPDSYKQADHLPGSEERSDWSEHGDNGKRSKLTESTTTTEEVPALVSYLGQDGQYYYDYGTYGYNHETQQYDPARLNQHPQYQYDTATVVAPAAAPSIQDRVNAALTAAAAAASSPNALTASSAEKNTSAKNDKPTVSALSALAAYGSESESDGEE